MRRWRVTRLKDNETRRRFEHWALPDLMQLDGTLGMDLCKDNIPQDAQMRIDRAHDHLIETINQAAENTIGWSAVNLKGRRGIHVSCPEMTEIARDRKRAWSDLSRTRAAMNGTHGQTLIGLQLCAERLGERHRSLVLSQRTLKKELLKTHWREFCKEVEHQPANEQLKRPRYMSLCRTRKRQLLRSDPESYRQYFAEQFARKPWQTAHRLEGTIDAADLSMAEELQLSHVSRAIRSLPNGKTPGRSGINAELIKATGVAGQLVLYSMFRVCLRWKVVPLCWRVARLCPVPKKGDLSLVSNYRPISLLEVTRKLFETCILKGLLLHRIEPLSPAQGGFRQHRSTIDQVACLHEAIIQRTAELGRPPVVAFLDIKAAYDSVDRQLLWKKLRDKGIPEPIISILQALYLV